MGGRERGAALLLVLMACTVLGVFLGIVVDRVSRETAATRRFLDELQARELVQGGVALALERLAADSTPGYDSPDEEWLRPVTRRVPAGEVRVAVSDEGSRLNLNTAPPGALARLPGVGPEELDRLLSFRQQWIEVPEQLRAVQGLAARWPELAEMVTTFGPLNPLGAAPEGVAALLRARGLDESEARAAVAELEEVRRKPPAEQPATLEELRKAVPSLSPGDWDRLQEDVVLDGTINAHLAPPEVLASLWAGLELGAESRLRLLDARQAVVWPETAALWTTLGDPAAAAALRPHLTVLSRVVRVDVEARAGEARVAARVVVRRRWDEGRPKLAVVSWAEVGQ
ncbi:MAG: type II secretion system protein GspK [Bacillota bacterium]|nr:type II secretion system protein GspK [Bacillota bacterium]